MQGHISLEVMKLFLTFGKGRGICISIMLRYLFAADPVLCLVGFAQPGEPLQGYSLTIVATRGSKLET